MLKIGKFLQKIGGGNIFMSKTNNEGPRYEICMYCGTVTDIPMDLPVDCRKNYVVGCGQLCEKCADALERGKPTPFREITN